MTLRSLCAACSPSEALSDVASSSLLVFEAPHRAPFEPYPGLKIHATSSRGVHKAALFYKGRVTLGGSLQSL